MKITRDEAQRILLALSDDDPLCEKLIEFIDLTTVPTIHSRE